MATAVDTSLDWLGRKLGAWLRQPIPGHEPFISSDPAALRRTLRPADVLLVAGGNRLSTAIKSHEAWDRSTLLKQAAVTGDYFDRQVAEGKVARRASGDDVPGFFVVTR